MYNSNSIFNSNIHLIQCYNIFRIMISYFHEIPYFTIRIFRNLYAYLYIDFLILMNCYKINLLCIILSNIHIIASATQFKVNNVFHYTI